MPDFEKTPIQQTRQSKLATILQTAGLDAVALNPGPTLQYLTGLQFHLMERPIIAIFIPHSPPVFVLPELESGKLEHLQLPFQAFPYQEDPQTWNSAFRQALQAAKLDSGSKIGIEAGRLRVFELRYLEQAVSTAEFFPAESHLVQLRIIKDEHEVKAMRRAAEIAQKALNDTLPQIKIGMTEKELATTLTLNLLKNGSQPKLPFSPLVASGPNSANGHAVPSKRRLAQGDLLLMDWGATFDGYVSDITRTFAIGNVDTQFSKIAQIVKKANAAGRSACKPEAIAGDIDQAARAVIEEAGYGEFFIHRTGHGLGMEGHEPPYIRSGNPLQVKPGMAFTIEPGIYLPSRGGIRIEDDVVITQDGVQCLTSLPRELITIG